MGGRCTTSHGPGTPATCTVHKTLSCQRVLGILTAVWAFGHCVSLCPTRLAVVLARATRELAHAEALIGRALGGPLACHLLHMYIVSTQCMHIHIYAYVICICEWTTTRVPPAPSGSTQRGPWTRLTRPEPSCSASLRRSNASPARMMHGHLSGHLSGHSAAS